MVKIEENATCEIRVKNESKQNGKKEEKINNTWAKAEVERFKSFLVCG